MHDFLSTLEWIDPAEFTGIKETVSRATTDLQFRLNRLLQSGLGKEVFGRPLDAVILWREKPYILRRGDQVANGIIDRAVLYLDKTGCPVKAVIYDFKTDTLDPTRPADDQLRERYAVQLERYREAVAVLTGLPMGSIFARLVPV